MSKFIQLNEAAISDAIAEFAKYLRGLKTLSGKVTYEKVLDKQDRKATVTFNPVAYAKMQYLVSKFSTESGWHGIARRVAPDKSDFIVDDIMIYPQQVTGATVSTDQKEYEEWLANLPDDVFNNVRFHGHSHVDFACSPSSVDMEHRNGLLQQLGSNDFYIFMIMNKKNTYSIAVYDMACNTLFETQDVDVKVFEDTTGFSKLMDDAEKMIKTKSYSAGYSYGNYTAGAYTGAYGKSYNSSYPSGKSAVAAASAAVSPAKNEGKKKGKRADKFDVGYNWWDDYDEY